MRDFVATKYDLPAHQLEVVPIHSNVEGITPLKTPSQFRVGNGLDGFVVLYAGNFARYQDFDTLLDAAKLLKDRSDITFVFVGDGAKKEDIQGRVEQEELHNVRMFPFVEEEQLCDLLNAADVSLVTLESGAAGLAVPSKFYNIMASGRATVAVTDPSSEVAQVIKEANCGVQVDPENAPQLAQVLAHLADSPDAVAAMGRNARHECEKKYSLESVARQYYDLFGRVAQQRIAGRRFKLLSKQRKARLDMQVTGVAPETVSGAVEGEAEAIREPARFSLLSLINR
jgi:glycosyltransferase involved in cell wall biosynthesis